MHFLQVCRIQDPVLQIVELKIELLYEQKYYSLKSCYGLVNEFIYSRSLGSRLAMKIRERIWKPQS